MTWEALLSLSPGTQQAQIQDISAVIWYAVSLHQARTDRCRKDHKMVNLSDGVAPAA